MQFHDQKGLLGFRLLLLMAAVIAIGVWAYYKGYIQWKGPRPADIAQEAVSDVSKSAKKLVK